MTIRRVLPVLACSILLALSLAPLPAAAQIPPEKPPVQVPGAVLLSDSEFCIPLDSELAPGAGGFLAGWSELGPRAVTFESFLGRFDATGAPVDRWVFFDSFLANLATKSDGSGVALIETSLVDDALTAHVFSPNLEIENALDLGSGFESFSHLLRLQDGTFLVAGSEGTKAVRFDAQDILGPVDLSQSPGQIFDLIQVGDELWVGSILDLPTSPPSARLTLQRRSLDGDLIGEPVFTTVEPIKIFDLELERDERGRIFLAWLAPGVAKVQRLVASGDLLGGTSTVAESSGIGELSRLGLTADPEGNLLVYFERRGGQPGFDFASEILGRTLLADGAFAGPVRTLAAPEGPDDVRGFFQGSSVLVSPGVVAVSGHIRATIQSFPEVCDQGPGVFAVPVPLGGERFLLLQEGRFRVRVDWRNPFDGGSGTGHAVQGTRDAGSFWFFDPDNKEIEIKVLDGRPINGHFWVFAAGLSNIFYEITVTDQRTGLEKTFTNPAEELGNFIDTEAFPSD